MSAAHTHHRETLHVVTMITNPVQYKSRVQLYEAFAEYMKGFANIVFWTVEGKYPGREYQVTDANNPFHLQLELEHELWHKENLLNVLIKDKVTAMFPDWKYVAWVDADIQFARPDWAEATIKKLQEHPVVQMFTECMDLSSRFEAVPHGYDSGIMTSCILKWHQNGLKPTDGYTRFTGHYGYAWAITREAYEDLEGLMDCNIVGSADYLMVHAFLGEIMDAVNPSYTPGYREYCRQFGERAKKMRQRGVPGYVDAMLMHYWRGPKNKRGYSERQRILDQYRFDPARDLVYQPNGALRWHTENPEHAPDLKWEMENYFRSRDEDVPSYEVADHN